MNKFFNLVQELAYKISSDNFDWTHIALLLVYLRPLIKNKRPQLFELTNFVPHGDIRNQGDSYKHIKDYMWNFINIAESEKGGTIFGKKPVFKKSHLLKELMEGLNDLEVQYDKKYILKNEPKIIDAILKIVNETTFSFKLDKTKQRVTLQDQKLNDCVYECVLEKDQDGRILFYIRLENLKDGVMKGISRNMRIGVPFIG